MKTRLSATLLFACWIAIRFSASDASAQESTTSKDKGVYDELPLKAKDYHLIETSEELHDQFQRRGLRYREPKLEAWLQSIGERLAPEATDFYQDYRFFLIRDPSPNAFALPDGQIYVHTGLIGRLENEAQLATLLAHEINHVAGHHSVLAYRSQKKKARAMIFVGVAGAAAGGWGDAAAQMVNLGLYGSIFGYSRDLEQEADINAYPLLLDAGYDVREMPKLFEILNQDFEGLQPRISAKWSTHPDLALRGDYTAQLAANTPADKIAGLTHGGDDFRSRVRPLALATVDDYIVADYPKSALVLAQQLAAEDPEDADAWTAVGNSYAALGVRSEYSEESSLSNKAKRKEIRRRRKMTREELLADAAQAPQAESNLDRNLAEAEAAYRTALEKDPGTADAFRGLGYTYKQMGKYRESGKAYMTYLKLKPNASDESIVMDNLREVAAKVKAESGE